MCYVLPSAHLSWQVEKVSEVLDALIGEAPVVVPPGKIFLNEATGLEGLHGLHHMQVRDSGQLRMLGQEQVLLTHDHSLCRWKNNKFSAES